MRESRPAELLCFGEPMIEFNDRSDGTYLYGFGGDVSNVAIAAARQGARAGMVTRLGADSFGDDLVRLWEREGVNTAEVARDEAAPTGLYFVRHGPHGHHFEYRRAGSAASLITPEDLPAEAIRQARCLHFSGISQAISAGVCEACDAALEIAQAAGTLVSYDPNLRLSLWPLDMATEIIHRTAALVDIFLPGLDDAVQLSGLTVPEDIVRYYLDLGAKRVALTLGERGAMIGDGEAIYRILPRPATCVDASGAGDCFDGAFLARVLADDPDTEAAAYAVAAASLSVQGYGAVTPIPTAAHVRAIY